MQKCPFAFLSALGQIFAAEVKQIIHTSIQ